MQEEVGERVEAGKHVWAVGGEGHHARLAMGREMQGMVGEPCAVDEWGFEKREMNGLARYDL